MKDYDKFFYTDQLTKEDIEYFITQELIRKGEISTEERVYCKTFEKKHCKNGNREYLQAYVVIPYKVKNKTVYEPAIYNINDYSVTNTLNFDWIQYMYKKFGKKYKEDLTKFIFGE